jgi:hypothetical protein
MIENADQLASPRHHDADEFFNGKAESVLLSKWGYVIKTVEVGNGLQIGLGFDQFLRTSVQQSYMWINTSNHFAVKLKDETQHPVRGGMLRPEVDREVSEA